MDAQALEKLADREFIRAYPAPDCGCPCEEWRFGGLDVLLHFEADGTMEAFIDAGDWDHELPLSAASMDAARDEVARWIGGLPRA